MMQITYNKFQLDLHTRTAKTIQKYELFFPSFHYKMKRDL